MRKWVVRGEIYKFPKEWDKESVGLFINRNIRSCQFCGKIDVLLDHFDHCDPDGEARRQESLDNYWG